MIRVACAVLLYVGAVASTTLAQSGQYREGGYANRHSVAVGESISFHIATSRSPFDVDIVNLASPFNVVQRIPGVLSQPRDCTGRWEQGCDWPVTANFTIPSNFTPGYYSARFQTGLGERNILFVVRAAVPGSYAPIVVIQPSNSDVAYNPYGGKSVYDTISTNRQRAHIVSFNRPYDTDAGFARFQQWERRFVEWMKAENRRFEVITDSDMEAEFPLSAYKAVLIVGHSEYWSLKARRHLEAYSRAGGHVAIFGANTMWWQVRVDLQTRQMTVYKDAALDPMTGVNDDLVTTNFFEWPVLNPENTILGSSFLNAAYVNKLGSYERVPVEQRIPYTVRKATHWAFEGTGLANGAEMGKSVGAIEVDGSIFNTLPSGDLLVEGSDGTPLSYEVLATLPSSDGYATIGFYANAQGGGVFNGAARDWAYGLTPDPTVARITRNVLDRFSTGAPFAFEPRVTPNRAEDLFNTPRAAPEYLPGWRFHRFDLDVVPQCAREGARGLELKGEHWTQVVRHLAVGRTGLSRGALNVWINTDTLQNTAGFGTPLVSFIDYRGPQQVAVASLDIMDRANGRSVRLNTYDAGVSAATTPWVRLGTGWQSVQISWQSPGEMTINVGGLKATAFNPKSGQKVNALMLEFAGDFMTGAVCMDQLQFRDAFAPAVASTSTISAAPQTIGRNQTSTITVRLHDANGDPLVNGGDVVSIASSLGTVSPVVDRGDGSYTTVLTPGAEFGTATITARLRSQLLSSSTTVTITGPPEAPGELAATPVSASRIDLSWNDWSETEDGFRVERCTGASCTSFAPIGSAEADATSFSDLTVSGATTYRYRLFAFNAHGDSSPSSLATATTPAACTTPAITAQPQSQSISAGSSATLSVDATGTALSYQWFAGTSPITGANGASLTVSPSATTSYFVRITNSCGGTDSEPATVTVAAAISISRGSSAYPNEDQHYASVADAGSGATYSWSATNGAIVSGNGTRAVRYSAGAEGSVELRVTVTQGGDPSLGEATVPIVPRVTGGTRMYVVSPCRLYDSRGTTPLANNSTRTLLAAGQCGIAADAKSVIVNVTSISPAASGFLTLYPSNTVRPSTTTVSYRATKTRANNSVMALGTDGALSIYNSGSDLHFIIDATGYFR